MYIDITFPINSSMPTWPNSVGYSYEFLLKMPEQSNNLSAIKLDCHFGTHLDAPLHFVEKGKAIESLDLSVLIGPCFVKEIRNTNIITYQHLQEANIPSGTTRLLLKTDNQIQWERGNTEFFEDFCGLDETASLWCVENNIQLIGIDYLSIQRFTASIATHQVLLEKEIIILETLKLDEVTEGHYELICLPIKLEKLEGAPMRALLKKI